MIYFEQTITLTAADDNGISTTQTPSGAGNLTITGALAAAGVATLDIARRVAVYSASDISTRTFTIYGTDRNGIEMNETITGPNNSTVYTSYDFKTVTRVAISGSAAGAIIVGTNEVASTAWIPLNVNMTQEKVALFVTLSAAASLTYTVEDTPVEVNKTPFNNNEVYSNVSSLEVFPHPTAAFVTASTKQQGSYDFPIIATSVTLNSFTSGTLTFRVIQNGN